jgi:hypothetical protein
VNVGATRAIERSEVFGYPVCTVCGYSVSPLSSERQRKKFAEEHAERCRRTVQPVGFCADVTADALTLPACPDQSNACSLLETLRMAAAQVLDMTMNDLQVLVIGHVDRDEVDAVLWDPMPGGSGLLDQLCARFPEIIAATNPWRHLQITLQPLNRDYQPIILTAEDEGQVTVIAEFVQRL